MKELAGKAVEALRSEPLLLGLMLVNLIFVGAVIWLLHEIAEAVDKDRTMSNTLLQQCLDRRPVP